MIGPDNLTALAAFCNTLFYYFEIEKDNQYSVARLRAAQSICFAFEASVSHKLWIPTAAESVAGAAVRRVNMSPD